MQMPSRMLLLHIYCNRRIAHRTHMQSSGGPAAEQPSVPRGEAAHPFAARGARGGRRREQALSDEEGHGRARGTRRAIRSSSRTTA